MGTSSTVSGSRTNEVANVEKLPKSMVLSYPASSSTTRPTAQSSMRTKKGTCSRPRPMSSRLTTSQSRRRGRTRTRAADVTCHSRWGMSLTIRSSQEPSSMHAYTGKFPFPQFNRVFCIQSHRGKLQKRRQVPWHVQGRPS